MSDKSQWPRVDIGFKMLPPKLGRSAGRPQKNRVPNSAEGKGKGKQKRCSRCKGFGHQARTCKEPEWVDLSDPASAPAPPKRKKRKTKPAVVVVSKPQTRSNSKCAASSSSQPLPTSTSHPAGVISTSQPPTRTTPPRLAKTKAKATGV
ncbi:uncharacterized protein LOC107303648 [Oryza brachyantha]|uniref:uncharacterized protein LOC107303648 n=1 Tax=Oryza brachyantha TaxID=4533 RepID=UPI00077616BD|nr:uncharacterized protein LOC107303648 [Oryza brachyantha]